MTRACIERIVRGEDLSRQEAAALMGELMSGAVSDVEIAAVLTGLRVKGESIEEIVGFATAMRSRAVPVRPQRARLVDTCGTGGDGADTFNISTAAAIVAAGAGVAVAKHGNRAVSSRCGSADVLEALGVTLSADAAGVARLIDRVGIGFMFAPHHHPAMRHVAAVRRQLRIRTVFNLLGPLTNPAGVRRQLVGVFAPDLTEPTARVLQSLGSEKVYVVHGSDGSDEISITGSTRISCLERGVVRTFPFSPSEVGLDRANLHDLAGGDAAHNARRIEAILDGETGPCRDAVVLNAAFVIEVSGRASSIAAGVDAARAAIDGGRARAVLEALRSESAAVASTE